MTSRFFWNPRKSGRSPGSVMTTVLLVVALVVVILVWWKVRAGRRDQMTVLAGPLLPIPTEGVTGLLMTAQSGQFRLDRVSNEVWTLSGGSEDFVDPSSMTILLADLAAAQGDAVLPGTLPEDRRYEFNGPGALRLTVFYQDQNQGEGRLTLALGTINPVTGRYYASGMRRAGCFMVNAGVRERLAGLPRSVELQTLLPPVVAEDLTRISVWRGGTENVLQRFKERWWLKVPDGGVAALGEAVAAYQALYQDRWRQDQDGDWVLASDEEVGTFVYEMDRMMVREIKPAVETAAWFSKWGLDDPWRKVILTGPGINCDPTAASADQLTLVLGAPLGPRLIPVARRGVVLLVDAQAGNTLDRPLGGLVHLTALTFKAMDAVKLQVSREDRVVLAGERPVGPWTGDGRDQWVTTFPPEPSDALPAHRWRAMAGEAVVDLDRMKLIKPLPPVRGESPLQQKERVEVRLTYPEGDGVHQEIFQVGRLKQGALADLTDRTDGDPVALWRPDTGQLLQVNDTLVVTARNLATF